MPTNLLETWVGNVYTEHWRKSTDSFLMVMTFTNQLKKNGYSSVPTENFFNLHGVLWCCYTLSTGRLPVLLYSIIPAFRGFASFTVVEEQVHLLSVGALYTLLTHVSLLNWWCYTWLDFYLYGVKIITWVLKFFLWVSN